MPAEPLALLPLAPGGGAFAGGPVTLPMALLLGVLGLTLALLVSGRVRTDLVAVLVLVALAALGLVSPTQAIAGFSNPAVIAAGGMLVVSAGLSRTGIGDLVGSQVLRVGGGPVRISVVLMLSAAVLSAFISNVGVVAMLLPVAVDVARRTGIAPSRLLLPMVLAAHLGGLTTLVGTPPNLLASDALREAGLQPLAMFDFTPVGFAVTLCGIALLAVAAPALLPARPLEQRPRRPSLSQVLDLPERLFYVHVPPKSTLDGRSIAQSRLRPALGLHVLAVIRGRRRRLAPGPDVTLRGGDRLLVQGRPDLLRELREGGELGLEDAPECLPWLGEGEFGLGEVLLAPGAPLVGRALDQDLFRQRHGVLVVALIREGLLRRTVLQDVQLRAGDRLLLLGPSDRLPQVAESLELGPYRALGMDEVRDRFRLQERLLRLAVAESSRVVGRTLAWSRLGAGVGVRLLALRRGEQVTVLPAPEEVLQAGDELLLKAKPKDLELWRGLRRLEIDPDSEPDLSDLESEDVGLLEVVLAPQTRLEGMAPRQIGFRDKFGVNVIALWRRGEARTHDLRDTPLKYGDALVLFGRRDRLRRVAEDPEFLALQEPKGPTRRLGRAPLAVGVLAATLAAVVAGYLSLPVAALMGAAAMILTGCLKPEEAYRSVEWPALVLIAGMLPLGTAMAETGLAAAAAGALLDPLGAVGPWAVLAGLCLLTAAGAQVVPAAAMVVLMAPIALQAAGEHGLSPQALLLGVALSSASVASPLSHAANALVMGPGGYRAGDYLRLGAPLALLTVALVVLLVPLFLPLTG